MKVELCHIIKRACGRKGWSQRESALRLGTSRCCMHNVDRLKVDKLTLSQLFRYLARAEPRFQMLIAI